MKNKPGLKASTITLIVLAIVLVTGVFASNIVLKKTYDKVDKSDLYWNYNNILTQPYKHLILDGGNLTNIMFEQSKHPSVRVLNYWWGYEKDKSVKAYVKNDTLHLIFPKKLANPNDKWWMKSKVLVRLFAPQLLSVDGTDTDFEMQKLKQSSVSVNLKGKSRFEVESYNHNFDTLNVSQTDSSQVVFEMSPELKGTQTMTFAHVNAVLKGYTLLDIGHGYVNDLKLKLEDSSAVILSGKSLGRLNK